MPEMVYVFSLIGKQISAIFIKTVLLYVMYLRYMISIFINFMMKKNF